MGKDEEDDEDEEDSEDEQDEGWDIYNSVVDNLNEYMSQIALFAEKMQEQKEMIENMEGPHEEEGKELENVVEKMTEELTDQIRRNQELESALSNVLSEYSERIDKSNRDIFDLHEKLRNSNEQHDKQMNDLKSIYESKIKDLQQTESSQYKREVSDLIDTLTTARADFQNQIVSLTKEMNEAQTNHHREMVELQVHSQKQSEQLVEKTKQVEELK